MRTWAILTPGTFDRLWAAHSTAYQHLRLADASIPVTNLIAPGCGCFLRGGGPLPGVLLHTADMPLAKAMIHQALRCITAIPLCPPPIERQDYAIACRRYTLVQRRGLFHREDAFDIAERLPVRTLTARMHPQEFLRRISAIQVAHAHTTLRDESQALARHLHTVVPAPRAFHPQEQLSPRECPPPFLEEVQAYFSLPWGERGCFADWEGQREWHESARQSLENHAAWRHKQEERYPETRHPAPLELLVRMGITVEENSKLTSLS